MTKQLPLLILIILCSFHSGAQNFRASEIAFFGGKSFTNFLFRAEQENQGIDYHFADGFNFGMNYYFSWNDRLSVRGEAIVHRAGAQATYGGNAASWQLNYTGVGAGYLFAFLQEGQSLKVKMEAGLNLGFDYLISAYQTVNSIRYDLKEESAFKNINLRTGPMMRLRYNPLQKLYIGLEYRFDFGLLQIEDADASTGQKTNNYGHMAQAFVSFKIF